MKGIGYAQLGVAGSIFLIAFTLFTPSVGKKIGMVPKYKRNKLGEDKCEVCATNGVIVSKSECGCGPGCSETDNEGSQSQMSCSLVMASRNTLYSDHSHMPTDTLIKSIFKNKRFLLILLSYACSTSVFNTVMYHQPTRLLKFGFSLSNGAQSIAINGVVQVFFRITAGFLAASNRVSPFRYTLSL